MSTKSQYHIRGFRTLFPRSQTG